MARLREISGAGALLLALALLALAGELVTAHGLHARGATTARKLMQRNEFIDGVVVQVGSDFYLLIGGASAYRLVFSPADVRSRGPALREGLRVRVTGYMDWDNYTVVVKEPIRVLYAGSSIIDAEQPMGRGLAPQEGDLTTLVIPVNLCGSRNNIDREAFREMYMGRTPAGQSPTSLKSYFEQCSWGTMKVPDNPNQNMLYSGVVNINGKDVCDSSNPCSKLHEMADEAESDLSKAGIDVNSYTHRIYLVPNDQPGCDLYGRGDIDCVVKSSANNMYPGCRSYLRLGKDGVPELRTMVHELGHNMALGHSRKDGEEYGDPSCPMGHSGDGCFNSMHAYKLGWATNPVAFDTKDLRPGVWTVRSLKPRAASQEASFMKITEDAAGDREIFLSYIAPVGFDADAASSLRNKMMVYAEVKDDPYKSDLLDTLSAGDRWVSRGSYPKLVVRLGPNPSNSAATVQLCLAGDSNDCVQDPVGVGETRGGDDDVKAPPPRQRSPPPRQLRRAPPPPNKKASPPPKKN